MPRQKGSIKMRPKGSKNRKKEKLCLRCGDTVLDHSLSLCGNCLILNEIAPYKVNLRVNDKDHQSEGNTLLDAIMGLKLENYKTRGILKVMKDNKKTDRILNIQQMKKLFSTSNDSFIGNVFRTSVAKYIETILK